MGCGASKITQIKINSFERILDSYIKEKEQKEIESINKKYEDKKQNFPDSTENQLNNNSKGINSKKQSKTSNSSVQHKQQQKNSINEQQVQINAIYAKYKKQKVDYMIKYQNLLLSKKQAKESDQHKLYAQKKKELKDFVKLFEPIQKQLLLAYPCISEFEFVNLPEIQLKDEQLIKALIKEQSKSLKKTNQIQDQSSKINNQNKQKEMLNSTQDIILKDKQDQEKQSQSNEKQGTMSQNPIQNQQNQLNQTNKKQNNEIIENYQRKNQQINQSIKKDENKSQNQQNTQIDKC